MALSYGWQKFHEAIHILTSEGTLEERISRAIAPLMGLEPDHDLPKDVIRDFKTFMKFVTSVEGNSIDGNIAATIKSLQPIPKRQVVDDIISMHYAICKEMGAKEERNSRI